MIGNLNRRPRATRLLWALFDQGIVSLGNFGLNITLGRVLDADQYGIFAFLNSIFLFLFLVHQSLVVYPLSIKGATSANEELGQLLGAALLLTALLNIPFAIVVCFAAYSVHASELTIICSLALISWQVQEVFRRTLMSQLRLPATIGTDSIRYLGVWAMAVIVALLQQLTLLATFILLIIGSIFGSVAAALATPKPLRTDANNIMLVVRQNWNVSRLLFWSSLISVFSGQAFLWAVTWAHGTASTGAFQAIVNIVAISSPIVFGIENLLVPEIARQWPKLAPHKMRRQVGRYVLAGAVLTAPFFIAIFIAPAWVTKLLYGPATSYAVYAVGLKLLVVAYVLSMTSTIIGAGLKGCGETQGVFAMQFWSALSGAVLGIWLTIQFGVVGACTATLLCAAVRTTVGIRYFLKIDNSSPQ